MTDRYVDASVGSSGTGTSWAQAYKTLKEATDAAAAGETIYFYNGTADVIGADVTYTMADAVRVVSTSDRTNNPPTTYATGATISTTVTGVDITINGTCAWYGVYMSLGDSSDANLFNLARADGSAQYYYDCAFTFGGTNTSGNFYCNIASAYRSYLYFQNCSWTWAATGQGIIVNSQTDFVNCDFSAGATHPSVLFKGMDYGGIVSCYGCDISDIATVFETSPEASATHTLSQCKLKASSTIFAPTTHAAGDCFVFDCDSGDVHINIAHYNFYGSTTVSTSVYATDNIADSNLSWKVEGTANASKATPYYSPWIDKYNSATSATTPYLEVLRVAGTPANGVSYLESEAWIQVFAKTTSGSTNATLYTNRASPLDTTTDNEDSTKSASNWVGEDASNNWYGLLKLNNQITPAEAGYIRARVGLAGQYTLYVDPQIRFET